MKWCYIEGFGGNYEISNSGLIRSVKRKRIMKQKMERNGYFRINLSVNGKKTMMLVHRLLATAFIPNPQKLPTINHINGIKSDNRLENLEWASRSDQNRHAAKLGLKVMKGEKHSQNKLTEQDVLKIRERRFNGEKLISIANDYPVSKGTISDVTRGRSWTHL